MSELMLDADGSKIWPELEVDAQIDHEIAKCRYSAFVSGSSNLERLLRSLRKDNLLLTGVATEVCVATTAMDAMMLDFQVTVISDATATFYDFFKQAYLLSLRRVFTDVVTTDEVIKEINEATS